MEWKYHLIIADQIPAFIAHDLAIYGAYNAGDAWGKRPGETEIIYVGLNWCFCQLEKQLRGGSQRVILSPSAAIPLRNACNLYVPQ